MGEPTEADATTQSASPRSQAQALGSSLRVFISCTQEDLDEHVHVVCEQINRLGWVPVYQKLWPASGRPSVNECLERVRSCQLLVVLVAYRYGWIPSRAEGGDGRRSITCLEVAEARRRGLEVLPFLVDETASWPIPLVEDRENPAIRKLLDKFKTELTAGLRGKFNEDPASLAQPAYQSLHEAGQHLLQSRASALGASPIANETAKPAGIVQPGIVRGLFDRALPRIHTKLTALGTFPAPTELPDLRHYLGELRTDLQRDIQGKLYVPNFAKPVPGSPFGGEEGPDPFARPIHRIIRELVGRSYGADSVSAQVTVVNRKSRVVRNLVRALLRSNEPVVLLGDPGTGKTLTLQQTALVLIDRELLHVFPKLTIYVRLGEFHVPGAVTAQHVWEFVKRSVTPEIAASLPALEQAERLVILFDGMDEMSREAYTSHTEALSRFAGSRIGNKTLFSCRITDFSPAFVHQRLVLLPFDRGQIAEYVKGHFPHGAIINGKLWKHRKLAKHLAQGSLSFDGTNPFVLWLLCFHLNEKHTWPDSRVDLLRYYLIRIYSRKAEEAAAAAAPFPARDETFLLWGRMAYVISARNEGSAINIADLCRELQCDADSLASPILAGKRCGMLVESKEGHERQLRFENHRYQEFFTSLYICNAEARNIGQTDAGWWLAVDHGLQPSVRIDWLQNLDAPRWQETMLNLALMGSVQEGVDVLISKIGDSVSLYEAEFERHAVQKARFEEAKKERSKTDSAESTQAPPEPEFGAPRIADADEIEFADRVELGARMLRHAQGQLAHKLKPPLLRASSLLIKYGNPITQIKMIRACISPIWICST